MPSRTPSPGVTRRAVLAAGAAVVGGTAVGRVRARTDRDRYFLAPWGDDRGPGTRSRPFRTLEPVANGGDYEAPDGATVVFRAGVYEFDDADSFSRQDDLTFRTDGDGRVVIDGSAYEGDVQASGLLQFFDCDGVTVRNLELRHAPGAAIKFIRSRRPRVVECLAHHNGNAGVYFGEVRGGTIRRCEVFGNYSPEGNVPGGASDGIALTASGSRRSVGGVVELCDVHHNSDDGIDLFHAKDVTVRYNRAWANGFAPNGDPVGEAAGKGIKLGSPRSRNDGGHVVHSNLAWYNGHAGIGWNGADRPTVVVNNTVVFNGRKPWLKESIGDDVEFFDAHRDCLIANNVALSVDGGIRRVRRDRVVANSWQLGVRRVADAGFRSVAVDAAGYPVDPSAFLRLADDSPLRGAGTDVGFSAGGRPDVGAPVVDVGPRFLEGLDAPPGDDRPTPAPGANVGDGTGPAPDGVPGDDSGSPPDEVPGDLSARPIPFDSLGVWAATLGGLGYLLRRRVRGRRVDRE